MPPLLGRPEGQNEMAVDLPLSERPEGQNEMAVDLAFKRAACKAERNGP